MPIGEQRVERGYKQMELNPHAADGVMHSPERVRMRVEQARQQAEYYEQQRMQLESQRRELELSNEQKAIFSANLNEVGMKLHNAVRRLEQELESMDREQREVENVNECFKRHLQILSALQPQNWSTDGFQDRVREALPKLDRAENDFNEAYAMGRRFRHTDAFLHKPGTKEKEGLSWRVIREFLVKGLAFHCPLFILLLITWLFYLLIASASPTSLSPSSPQPPTNPPSSTQSNNDPSTGI